MSCHRGATKPAQPDCVPRRCNYSVGTMDSLHQHPSSNHPELESAFIRYWAFLCQTIEARLSLSCDLTLARWLPASVGDTSAKSPRCSYKSWSHFVHLQTLSHYNSEVAQTWGSTTVTQLSEDPLVASKSTHCPRLTALSSGTLSRIPRCSLSLFKPLVSPFRIGLTEY